MINQEAELKYLSFVNDIKTSHEKDKDSVVKYLKISPVSELLECQEKLEQGYQHNDWVPLIPGSIPDCSRYKIPKRKIHHTQQQSNSNSESDENVGKYNTAATPKDGKKEKTKESSIKTTTTETISPGDIHRLMDIETFLCCDCGYVGKNSYNLSHIYKHAEWVNSIFTKLNCEKCNLTFINPAELFRHLQDPYNYPEW